MLIQDLSPYEISVDPDQLASEKPADQDSHCFHPVCKYILVTGTLQVTSSWKIIGVECCVQYAALSRLTKH